MSLVVDGSVWFLGVCRMLFVGRWWGVVPRPLFVDLRLSDRDILQATGCLLGARD